MTDLCGEELMPHRKFSQQGTAKANQPFPIQPDEILDWDVALEVVPARPCGTIEVVLEQAPHSNLVVDDPAED